MGGIEAGGLNSRFKSLLDGNGGVQFDNARDVLSALRRSMIQEKSNPSLGLGPATHLGIACAVISQATCSRLTNSFWGEASTAGSKETTVVLKVWVPENSTSCKPLALPGDPTWKDDYYREINMLPEFVGLFQNSDNMHKLPSLGDIVTVEYNDPSKPQEGGKYLGIAFRKKNAITGEGETKPKDAYKQQSTDEAAAYLDDITGPGGLPAEALTPTQQDLPYMSYDCGATLVSKRRVGHQLVSNQGQDINAAILEGSDSLIRGQKSSLDNMYSPEGGLSYGRVCHL